MTPAFNVADSSTWPTLMTAEHIAEIWGYSVNYLHKQCALGKFVPAPKDDFKPRRWRKEDVLRHVEPSKVPVPRGLVRRVS